MNPPTPERWRAVEAALDHAAWYGHPAAGIAFLPRGVDPDDVDAGVPERVRWLAGVCLGAVGRYRTAARWLAPGGEPAGSLAASCLASHLRQLGRHAEAEPLDRLALSTTTDPEARADALIGLVADAVGRNELALARDRLHIASQRIVAVTTDYARWRARVRLEWVTAETALLAGEATRAVEVGRTAQRISRTATAYRHTVKSTLVLGVALDAAAHTRAAVRVLRTASHEAVRMGLIPLVSPIHMVLAGTLQDRAPLVAARERMRADAAQSIREDPAESQSFVRLLDGPHVRPRSRAAKLFRPGFPQHHPDGLQSRGRSTSRGVMYDQLRPALRRIPVTSVLICDERRGVRDGLAQFMSVVPGVDRVDTVASGDDMLERYPRERPDVVLVGTQRAVDTGIVLTRRLVSRHPRACVLVFGAADDTPNIVAAVACGARGYLRWDASHAEVCAALAHALAGVELAGPRPVKQDADIRLTQRELQVLVGMTEGKSNGEIGKELFLSEDTVKTHARRLFRKLGVNDRAQAVAHGFRRGLVS